MVMFLEPHSYKRLFCSYMLGLLIKWSCVLVPSIILFSLLLFTLLFWLHSIVCLYIYLLKYIVLFTSIFSLSIVYGKLLNFSRLVLNYNLGHFCCCHTRTWQHNHKSQTRHLLSIKVSCINFITFFIILCSLLVFFILMVLCFFTEGKQEGPQKKSDSQRRINICEEYRNKVYRWNF